MATEALPDLSPALRIWNTLSPAVQTFGVWLGYRPFIPSADPSCVTFIDTRLALRVRSIWTQSLEGFVPEKLKGTEYETPFAQRVTASLTRAKEAELSDEEIETILRDASKRVKSKRASYEMTVSELFDQYLKPFSQGLDPIVTERNKVLFRCDLAQLFHLICIKMGGPLCAENMKIVEKQADLVKETIMLSVVKDYVESTYPDRVMKFLHNPNARRDLINRIKCDIIAKPIKQFFPEAKETERRPYSWYEEAVKTAIILLEHDFEEKALEVMDAIVEEAKGDPLVVHPFPLLLIKHGFIDKAIEIFEKMMRHPKADNHAYGYINSETESKESDSDTDSDSSFNYVDSDGINRHLPINVAYSQKFAKRLIEQKLFPEAIRVASSLSNPEHRDVLLDEICTKLLENDHIDEAFLVAKALSVPDKIDKIYGNIIKRYLSKGHYVKAKQAAFLIQFPYIKQRQVRLICDFLLSRSQFAEAFGLINEIPDEVYAPIRRYRLKEMGFVEECNIEEVLLKEGHFDEALTAIDWIAWKDPTLKDEVLTEIIKALVKKDLIDKAIEISKKLTKESYKDLTTRLITSYFIDRKLPKKALEIAQTIIDDDIRKNAFLGICDAFIQTKDIDQAEALLATFPPSNKTNSLLIKLAALYLEKKCYTEVSKKVCYVVLDKGLSESDEFLITQIIQDLSKAQRFFEAFVILDQFLVSYTKTCSRYRECSYGTGWIFTIYSVGNALDREGAEKALEALHLLTDTWTRDRMLNEIINRLLKDACFDEAVEAVKLITDESIKHKMLINIVRSLAFTRLYERAIALSESLTGETKENAYLAIVEAFAQQKLYDQAHIIKNRIIDPILQAKALIHICRGYASEGDDALVFATIDLALMVSNAIKDSKQRDEALKDMTLLFVSLTKYVDQTIKLALSIQEKGERDYALGKIAVELTKNNCVDNALKVVDLLFAEERRSYLLETMAGMLLEKDRVEEVEKMADDLVSPQEKTAVLTRIVNYLNYKKLYKQAIAVCNKIIDPDSREEAFSSILFPFNDSLSLKEKIELALGIANDVDRIHFLSKIGQKIYRAVKSFDEICSLIETISNKRDRSLVLMDLCDYLVNTAHDKQVGLYANKIPDDRIKGETWRGINLKKVPGWMKRCFAKLMEEIELNGEFDISWLFPEV